MIVGSLLGHERAAQLTANQLDKITEIALNEFVTNPKIDEQVRSNPIIMQELAAAVSKTVKSYGGRETGKK